MATTSEPLATRGLILRGIGVGWVPSLLVGEYSGVAIRPVKEPIRRRDIYALLPPGDRHPRARQVIDALLETATDFAEAPGRHVPFRAPQAPQTQPQSQRAAES